MWMGYVGQRLTNVDERRELLDVKEQRVYVMPRAANRAGELTTALRVTMDGYDNGDGSRPGVGVWRLEKASGVSHQTLANLAKGRGGVEKAKAERIADALGVTVGALFVHKDGAELVDA